MDTTKTFDNCEPVDAAAAAAATAASNNNDGPYTISEAHDVFDDVNRQWEKTRHPKAHEWVSFAMHLSRVERSLAAMIGLGQISAEHEFAKQSAAEFEVPCKSITDYQAGCVRDAHTMLAWLAHDYMDRLRERYSQ